MTQAFCSEVTSVTLKQVMISSGRVIITAADFCNGAIALTSRLNKCQEITKEKAYCRIFLKYPNFGGPKNECLCFKVCSKRDILEIFSTSRCKSFDHAAHIEIASSTARS